jgi:hypothetical protein
MNHPEILKTRQPPCRKAGTATAENAGAFNDPFLTVLPFRRGAVRCPESGNHSEAWIHEKESLCLCRAGKSIPRGIDRGPNSERMVNICADVNEG